MWSYQKSALRAQEGDHEDEGQHSEGGEEEGGSRNSNNTALRKKTNAFIRSQFSISEECDEAGKYEIVCKHCGDTRKLMKFNASFATKHIVEKCVAAPPQVKTEAKSQTQKARRLQRVGHENDEDGDGEEDEDEDGSVEIPRKKATKKPKKETGREDMVLIGKDELRELMEIKEQHQTAENAKIQAEKIKLETQQLNERINMASNLLEKRQSLLEKGVPQQDIDKLLPLSLLGGD